MSIYNQLDLNDYWRVIREFVDHYPASENKCERLNTFAVLDSIGDLNSRTLGKSNYDRGKDTFYSRRWERKNLNQSEMSIDFPGLLALDRNAPIENPFNQTSGTRVSHSIDLLFVDKYEEHKLDKPGTDSCSERNKSEIYDQAREFAFIFLEYMNDLVVLDNNRLINQAVKDADGDLAGNLVDGPMTAQFQKLLRQNNPTVNLVRWDGGKDNLHGCFISLVLSFVSCAKYTWSPELLEIQTGYDKNCC